MLDWVLKYLVGEARVITQAPVSFIGCVLVVTLLLYFAFQWRYGGVVENLEARLKIRDDRINEYQEKLKVASPAEAKARVDELEQRVQALAQQFGPRSLTEIQNAAFRDAATPLVGRSFSIAIMHDMACADCNRYANAFNRTLSSVQGWKVLNGGVIGPGRLPPSGLAVQVKNANALSEPEALIVNALRAARLPHNIIEGGPPNADLGILITAAAN